MEMKLLTWLAQKTGAWVAQNPQGWKAALVFALARKLPHCKQVAPLMSQAMERPLSWRQWVQVKLHLVVCLMCVRYQKQLWLLREAALTIATSSEDASLPRLSPEARERLKRALDAQER